MGDSVGSLPPNFGWAEIKHFSTNQLSGLFLWSLEKDWHVPGQITAIIQWVSREGRVELPPH